MYDFDNNVDPEDESSTSANKNERNDSNEPMEINNHLESLRIENSDLENRSNFKGNNADQTSQQTISSQTSPAQLITSNDGDVPFNNKRATFNDLMKTPPNESSSSSASSSSSSKTVINDWSELDKFPEAIVNEFDNYLERQRWMVGVPYQKFEQSLDIVIHFIESGKDEQDEVCQHFIYETIIQFFGKFCLDATSESNVEDHKPILDICFKLIEIVVLCWPKNARITELLACLFSTNNWLAFMSCNGKKIPNTSRQYAIENDSRNRNSLLIEMINYFGQIGGFDVFLSCFKGPNLSSLLIYAYLKPFDQCFEYLTKQVLETYFVPILDIVPDYFENLTDKDLKNELKSEGKTDDVISFIIKICKGFALKLSLKKKVKQFEFLRLKLTLRVLQFSSFSGKMNALNEINKTILYYSTEEPKFSLLNNCHELLATSEEMAQWLIENDVLEIILKDCLHQPQYVEKLDNIIRFLLKENALSLDCLDKIWNSQLGKHEIIVKNIHDLIAKLAWNFSPDQLNHLFLCFKSSWSTANKKEREKLLELMRRLAEDDKDGSMAHKVLSLLWNIAYNDDEVDGDIVDQALSAHVKILDYSKTCDRDSQKYIWLQRCVEEINKSDYGNNVITAIKQIREICMLFPSCQTQLKPVLPSKNKESFQQRSNQINRKDVLMRIDDSFQSCTFPQVCIKNLEGYMKWMRNVFNQPPGKVDPFVVCEGRRFSHCQEVQERLDFLRFLLQEGQLWLGAGHANEIWNCLAQQAIFPVDRTICFQWFSTLVDCESDLDPEIYLKFLETNITKLDPSLMDIYGVECFERFFKAVNIHQEKLIQQNQHYLMEDSDLTALDYLWKLILFGENEPAIKAINLLKDFYTNLGPKLIHSQVEIHHDFINTCFDRLKASYDTVKVIEFDQDGAKKQLELIKMTRVLSVLCEYINKCDGDFNHERTILPMSLCFRGKPVLLYVKLITYNEDLEILTHTNESLSCLKNKILLKSKRTDNDDIEFYIENEKIDLSKCKLIGQLTNCRKLSLSAKLISNTISLINDTETSNCFMQKNACLQKQENSLPGVIMSKNSEYANFLFAISDLAMSVKYDLLREKCSEILKLIPPDVHYLNLIRDFCINHNGSEENLKRFEQELLQSPTKTVYLLGIIYALLLPANNPLSVDSQRFQISFMKSRYFLLVINYLNDKRFLMNADNYCKICALSFILKISKFTLSALCYLKIYLVDDNNIYNNGHIEALKYVPSDSILRNVSINVAQNIFKDLDPASYKEMNFVPTSEFIDSILMVAWSTAPRTWQFNVNADRKLLHEYFVENYGQNENSPKSNDICDVCNEALEVLTIMFILAPDETHVIVDNAEWHEFFIDLLLLCSDESIRTNTAEQFTLILTKCMRNNREFNLQKESRALMEILSLMFNFLQKFVPNFYQTSSQFFQLFCNLLEFSFMNNVRLPILHSLLQYEYELLENPKSNFYFNDQFEETLLEGHLKITKELILFLNTETKASIGSGNMKTTNSHSNLIDLIMDQYLFAASKSSSSLYQQDSESEVFDDIYPICSSSRSLIAAYELLVALCIGCMDNLLYVCQKLEKYFQGFSINSWEYSPNIGVRPQGGFVGLKNAGATCYMNSVLQQLFMIPEVRNVILSVNIDNQYNFFDTIEEGYFPQNDNSQSMDSVDVKTYNINVLKQIQIIFGHLLLSQCQYYEPKGFWHTFRFMNAPINLREQQDALEFFSSLFDCLDEALKALGQTPNMTHIFGGSFSDQKICKDCPHRYCRAESFTTLNVDVRNHQSLNDSLEQYVRGDLLEGDNAYYCEKCDRKVNTVKRLCIKKLPKILVIQLKRFDYDYERETPIKFNDYFEFPLNLDMEPYTVSGLARKEGEIIEEDSIQNDITQYELTGIVVHSGQVNGGHYYSFILHQTEDGRKKWYKFDDVDVSECKLDQDEEMKNNCFGGEYTAEVFDQIMKTKTQKLQSRWWNAFILFYRKVEENKTPMNIMPQMPAIIKMNVQHQNIVFMNQRTLFSEEFYHFMRLLLECNIIHLNTNRISVEELRQIVISTLNIAAKFLFQFCFRAKKSLRNSAPEWYDLLIPYLKTNSTIRDWFIKEHLLNSPKIFPEFLLECPAMDVRVAFAKIIILLCHYSLLTKGFCAQNADNIMSILTNLIHKEVPEYIRQSGQYFYLFYQYSILGVEERSHLLKFDVPTLFILMATDQCSGFTVKGQYIDNKLYQVVSNLVRCCDLSNFIASIQASCQNELRPPLPNPFKYEENDYLMPLPESLQTSLFSCKLYWKKIIRDANTLDENVKLLKFCCWENQIVSRNIIDELLGLLSNSFAYELEPYFKILLDILLMEDSWQTFRIELAFLGDEIVFNNGSTSMRKGIFELMLNQLNLIDKKTFQCLQLLVHLLSSTEKAVNCVKRNNFLRSKWFATLQCLKDELSEKATQNLRPYNRVGWSSSSGMDSNRYSMDLVKGARLYQEAARILNENEPPIQNDNDDDDSVEMTETEVRGDGQNPNECPNNNYNDKNGNIVVNNNEDKTTKKVWQNLEDGTTKK